MKIENFEAEVSKIPTFILTCDKFTPEAEKCQKRLEKYGFSNIKLVYGDNDERLKNEKIDRQSRSFISTCLDMIENNTKYILIFEEDAEIVKNRYDSYKKLILWALENEGKWDIIYGGCAALNMMLPLLTKPNVSYSNRGQAGGHAMLFSLKAAKDYVKNNQPEYNKPFDISLRELYLRSYTNFLPVWYQNKNPGQIEDFNLNLIGDHKFWQDFSLVAWPLIIILPLILLFLILRFGINRYRSSRRAKK